jgi:hypothetical protein
VWPNNQNISKSIVVTCSVLLFSNIILPNANAQENPAADIIKKSQENLQKFENKSANTVQPRAQKSVDTAQSLQTDSLEPTPQQTQQVLSQTGNSYVNEYCGVSIELPNGWTATESDFTYQDKSKTLANIHSEYHDIFQLEFALENYGIAKYSPMEILNSERDYANLSPNAHILKSESKINGFPSYKIAYSTGSPGEYEFYMMDVLIVAYDREYRILYQAADKAEFDIYGSTIEDMAKTIKITKPEYQGINC